MKKTCEDKPRILTLRTPAERNALGSKPIAFFMLRTPAGCPLHFQGGKMNDAPILAGDCLNSSIALIGSIVGAGVLVVLCALVG